MNKRTRIRIAAVVAAFVAGVGLTACGTETIDNADLEAQLAEQLSADAGVNPDDVSVSCPSDIEVEEGREFECVLTAPDGDDVRVDVTLTDDDGGFDAVVPQQQFD